MGNIHSLPPRSVCEIFEVSLVMLYPCHDLLTSLWNSYGGHWLDPLRVAESTKPWMSQPHRPPPSPTKKITPAHDNFLGSSAPPPSTAEQRIQLSKHKAEGKVDVSLAPPMKEIAQAHPQVGSPSP